MSWGYSKRCLDRTTRLNRSTGQCVSCKFAPGSCPQLQFLIQCSYVWALTSWQLPAATGREITPNCGYDDDGGQHELPNKPCKDNTCNEGWQPYCKPCSQCPPGSRLQSPCNSTTDSTCAVDKVNRGQCECSWWSTPTAPFFLVSFLFFLFSFFNRSCRNSSKTLIILFPLVYI